ncbi:MAG: FadR/GntR family transcriptional regulator [Janthinobacterium lividum]
MTDALPSHAEASVFTPVRSPRAFEEITAQIRALVANGRLRPGDRLPAERDLAARLGVSRNTLREALRSLEISGLLALRKGSSGGSFIVPGNGDVVVNGLRDLFYLGAITPTQLTEARVWIEEIVIRVACERATDEDFAALDDNIADAERALASGDFVLRAELHVEFHSLLARATHNPVLAITMEGMLAIVRQFVARIGFHENDYTLPSRRRFMPLLRARDVGGARSEMHEHLEQIHQVYLSKLDAAVVISATPPGKP